MKRRKILIADDDRSMRSALRVRLEAWGYTVVEAVDGLEVLGAVAGGNVAAVILDQAMPRGDGATVARVIRRECAAPIIFVSGQSADVFAGVATELSDVYVLGKPLESARLRVVLEQVTGECGGPAEQRVCAMAND